jgi:hypothetical protein
MYCTRWVLKDDDPGMKSIDLIPLGKEQLGEVVAIL